MIFAAFTSSATAGLLAIAVDGRPEVGRAVRVNVVGADSGPVALAGTGLVPIELGRSWWWTPPRAGSVDLVATQGTVKEVRNVDVQKPATSRISAGPWRANVSVGTLDLQVDAVAVSADGATASRSDDDVTLRWTPGGAPRLVPVALWADGDVAPALRVVRLEADVAMPYDVEAGATLTLSVGGRAYGPFVADAAGHIDARVVQGPGERVADAVFRDRLGNETRTTLPLAGEAAPLIWVVPPRAPEGAGWVGAWGPTGDPLGKVACTVDGQAVVSVAVAPGTWRLDGVSVGQVVVCESGAGRTTRSLPGPKGVADRVVVRSWPETVRADFPTSDLRVAVETVDGERLPATGLTVGARHGSVRVEEVGGDVLRAVYLGAEAIDDGADWIEAQWWAPPSDGPAVAVEVGGVVSADGGVDAWARALDERGHPVPHVRLRLGAPGEEVDVITDATGVARARMPLGVGQVGVVGVRWGDHVDECVIGPGTERPLVPDRSAAISIVLAAGSAVAIVLDVEPRVVADGPSDVARLRIAVRDVAGGGAEEAPIVTASEGLLGELERKAAGSWTTTWRADRRGRARKVEITAEVGGVTAATTLDVEPGARRGGLGLWAGGISNFGRVASPTGGLDLDIHLRSVAEGLSLRVGGAVWRATADVDIGAGAAADLSSVLWPMHVAGLLRRDRRGVGLYLGVGGALAPEVSRMAIGNDVVGRGLTTRAGPLALGGAAWRLGPSGEVFGEVRASWLLASPEVGFTGNVGGVAVGAGYKVLY